MSVSQIFILTIFFLVFTSRFPPIFFYLLKNFTPFHRLDASNKRHVRTSPFPEKRKKFAQYLRKKKKLFLSPRFMVHLVTIQIRCQLKVPPHTKIYPLAHPLRISFFKLIKIPFSLSHRPKPKLDTTRPLSIFDLQFACIKISTSHRHLSITQGHPLARRQFTTSTHHPITQSFSALKQLKPTFSLSGPLVFVPELGSNY